MDRREQEREGRTVHQISSRTISRRRLIGALAVAPVIGTTWSSASRAAAAAGQITAAEARKRLVAGNARYLAGKPLRLDHSSRREAVSPAQLPFAIVLGCSDSRVPPEILFDQGLGDLFIIRVAGNIADDLALGSMEYAVQHFATPLIVVLGHERCGAVAATVEVTAAGTMPPPHISSLVTAIQPAVAASKGMPSDPVENAITTHVLQTVAALKASKPVLSEAVAQGKLDVVGAEYHLKTGKVGFLA